MPTTSLLTQAAPPEFSQLQFRQALGLFATGVTIITARGAQGNLVGLTANSFSSVSLEPPLVLWSLKLASSAMNVLAPASHYAIHILGADQQALAERFAGPQEQRWTGVTHEPGACGAPVLPGCVAVFECFNRSQYQEGDHVIFVGEVERCTSRPGEPPLLFHGGKFYTEHPL